jgi:hypothetical protein
MLPLEGWRFERVDDRHIRVVDPSAPYAVVLDLSDQAPEMRVFWRLASALAEPAGPVGIVDRIASALKRIEDGYCIRRIPADPTDPDLVLAECKALLEGRWPPFWIKSATP